MPAYNRQGQETCFVGRFWLSKARRVGRLWLCVGHSRLERSNRFSNCYSAEQPDPRGEAPSRI